MIDKKKEELDTPALLIDLDLLDKNINIAAKYYRSKKGAALLPHQKGHRLPIIARKQIDAGAVGVSMTSLGLAEYYVNSGINNILITSEVAGNSKINKICGLSKHSNLIVGVDDLTNVKHLSQTALNMNSKVRIAVELYMGQGTCGVEIDQTKSFVKKLEKLRGVDFQGLWWHQGALASIANFNKRKEMHFETLDKVMTLKDEIEDAGTSIEMLSGGFTATWNITPEYPHLENIGVQAGSYVFSDWASHQTEGIEVFHYALSVFTRCISRPKPTEAMFDFGLNSCTAEYGTDYQRVVGPKFKDITGIEKIRQREEICLVVFEDPRSDIKVGNAYEVIPPHSDTTAKLHNQYFGIRNNSIEVIWPNYGRGLL